VGEVIEFYHPVPKAVLTLASAVEVPESSGVKEVLTQCLEHADSIDQIVVLMENGKTMNFLGNLNGVAEVVLFLERMKARLLEPEGNTFA
jgi:hypothetical protein